MRLITGDEMGLLKTVDLEAKNIVVAGRQARERAIKAMCWTRGGKNYAVARQDGVVSLWEDGAKMPRLLQEYKGAVNEDVVGMASSSTAGGEEERLVVAHENGSIKVLAPWSAAAAAATDKADKQASSSVVTAAEWQTDGPISCMALGPGGKGLLAVGGKEREVGLYDLTTGQAKWEARNVGHDKLSLRQPVWVTAVHFLDHEQREGAENEDGEGESAAGNLLAIGTAYKQVRVYDVRAQRRPVRQMELTDGYRITAMCGGLHQHHQQIVTGDAGGTVYHLDLGKMALLGRLEGPAGSVRCLTRHPSAAQPFVALAGLDRMARVYDLRKPRKEAFRFYLKQRLNAVLFSAEGRKGKKGKAEEREDERKSTQPADEDELEVLEDDVGSFGGDDDDDDDDSSDEDGGEEEEDEDEEMEVEGAQRRGEGKKGAAKKGGAAAAKYQRIYGSESESESESEDSYTGEGGDGEEDDDSEDDDEEVPKFGRRNEPAANFELNLVGGGGENSSSEEEEEEEEDEEDAESGSEEEEEEEEEVQETKRGGRRQPVAAAKRQRK